MGETIPYRNCYAIAADVCVKSINKNNNTFERRYVGIFKGPLSDGYPYWHHATSSLKWFITIEGAKEYYNENKTYLSRNCVYKNVQIVKLIEEVVEKISEEEYNGET